MGRWSWKHTALLMLTLPAINGEAKGPPGDVPAASTATPSQSSQGASAGDGRVASSSKPGAAAAASMEVPREQQFSKNQWVTVTAGLNKGRRGRVIRYEPSRQKWLVRIHLKDEGKLYWVPPERLEVAEPETSQPPAASGSPRASAAKGSGPMQRAKQGSQVKKASASGKSPAMAPSLERLQKVVPRRDQGDVQAHSAAALLAGVWGDTVGYTRRDPRLHKMCAPKLLRGCNSCSRCTSAEGGNAYWCAKSNVCVPQGCHNCPLKRRECKFFEDECFISCAKAKVAMLETPKMNRWKLWDAGECAGACKDDALGTDAPHCYRKRPKRTPVRAGQKCFPGQYLPSVGKVPGFPTDEDLCCSKGAEGFTVKVGVQSPHDFSCDVKINNVAPSHWAILSDSTMKSRCGDLNECNPTCLHNKVRLPVRCCSDRALPDWSNDECSDVWSNSEKWRTAPRECMVSSYAEARSFCKLEGGRLCSQKEIEMGCVRKTGCGFDNKLIWSDNNCDLPKVKVPKKSGLSFSSKDRILLWVDPTTKRGRIILHGAIACIFLIPVMLCLLILGYCRSNSTKRLEDARQSPKASEDSSGEGGLDEGSCIYRALIYANKVAGIKGFHEKVKRKSSRQGRTNTGETKQLSHNNFEHGVRVREMTAKPANAAASGEPDGLNRLHRLLSTSRAEWKRAPRESSGAGTPRRRVGGAKKRRRVRQDEEKAQHMDHFREKELRFKRMMGDLGSQAYSHT